MRNIAIGVAMVCLTAPAVASTLTVQQRFEAASTALAAEKWADALAGFEALENDLKKNARSRAIVRVRKGTALHYLGRSEEAAAALKAGLADLPAEDTSLRSDRMQALQSLGLIDMGALDYASAAARFREAERFADQPVDKLHVLAGLMRVATFLDADEALAVSDRALPLLTETKADKASMARFGILRTRVLLNLGRFKEAAAEGRKAVDLLGGLGLRVDVSDVSARSDTAIAAMLAGDKENARRYMAYTGAGRIPNGGFGSGSEMQAPPCGGRDGLQPEDVAVVEFSIRDDGSVAGAQPIYASRRGESALQFARAVEDWSWTPEEVKKINPFFRHMTRIEIRCSTANARPSVLSLLDDPTDRWVADRKIEVLPIDKAGDARKMASLRAELARREKAHGAHSVQLLPPLGALSASAVVSAQETLELATRGLAILEGEKAPVVVRLPFAVQMWSAQAEVRRSQTGFASALERALADPAYAADPIARSALRLMLVDSWRKKRTAQSIVLLQQVADDPALAANDPFRVGALVRLASEQFRSGDTVAARTSFERTGLSARQCALIDAPPQKKAGTLSSSDFPMEAQRWGFDGWTRIQYDIAADGRTQNARTLIAYPPFVFGEASVRGVSGFRFEPSFRGGEALGCGGNMQGINFVSQNG